MTINYSYYPFLKGPKEHILQFDEESILYAKENIERYTPTKILDLDLPVWLISTVILRCLNNNYVTRKFVSNYGKMFEYRCLQGKDFMDKNIRLELLKYFRIFKDIEFTKVRNETFVRIHCLDYMEISEEGLSVSAPQFHLVNQILHQGFVFIELQPFLYLLRLALEHRLISKIKSMKLYTDNQLINDSIKELKEKYPEYDKLRAPSKTNIPYSIQELIDKSYREHHLAHHERRRLGIYLQGAGYDEEFILDIFRQCSDWNEKITRYQLQSLKRYIKPK